MFRLAQLFTSRDDVCKIFHNLHDEIQSHFLLNLFDVDFISKRAQLHKGKLFEDRVEDCQILIKFYKSFHIFTDIIIDCLNSQKILTMKLGISGRRM